MPERSNLFESHWSNQWLTQNQVIVGMRLARRRVHLRNLIERSFFSGKIVVNRRPGTGSSAATLLICRHNRRYNPGTTKPHGNSPVSRGKST